MLIRNEKDNRVQMVVVYVRLMQVTESAMRFVLSANKQLLLLENSSESRNLAEVHIKKS